MASPQGASPHPGNRGTRPPAGLIFSPEPGPSPIGGLCRNMGHLSCVERYPPRSGPSSAPCRREGDGITPRRRLRLSPDALTPSRAGSQVPAPAGTPTPTGDAPEPSLSPQACSSSSEGSCSQMPWRCSLPGSSKWLRGASEGPGEGSTSPQGMGEGSSGLSPALAPGTDGEILTGDFSRPCSLPLEDGLHRDLRYVSPATVASLLRGQLAGVVEEYVVVDCRYPYEYAGGHIKGALNLYREEQLATWFLPDPLGTTPYPRSSTLIFHCEFSSERGPRLCRSLRRMDRDANRYPELWYPELYMLRGGYKEFYEHFQDLCEPQGYIHMRHKDFRAELRNYQRRKKPWSLRRIRKELFKPLSPGTPLQ
ncbi:M-phase inducer phosphatase 3-like isoform X3 [Dermochelys coriacea]|uniref:M-phase inducer phosphatase 3-like isoform X3 n=1 Tax=Dermochelys coriacea TaxID=27794 RepID=UPI0018E76EFE|nr:M-phase inducer phosphatase 3-like isoform X3 [Dermochelys coriacea]